MSEIYIDLAENENYPLIRELIPNIVCYCRYMNDISKGAMLIKEKHRQLKEKQVLKYTLKTLQLQKLITTTGQKIVILHQLTMSFKVNDDCTKHIQSYLFQNGSKSRLKLEKLHVNHYYNSVHCERNLYYELTERHKKFSVRNENITEYACYFYYRNNKYYKNNNPHSFVLNTDLNWLTNEEDTPFISDPLCDMIDYGYSADEIIRINSLYFF
jgi:hypothetical protein